MNETYLNFFEQMFLIRETELSLLELFSRGLLRGTVHTCIGQEACAVGVVSAIDKEKDILFSNHRGHGHYISYSGDIRGLIAEVMGKKEGICGGIGGSQHLHVDNFYSNGIQGAGVPIIAGMALAEKIKKTDAIAISFIGDGTFGEGSIYEAFNIASLWKVPMLIVVEHNQYAQSTPTYDQHAGKLETRTNTFNIPVTVEDGMDVIKVYNIASKIIDRIRETSHPEMLFLNTYRFAPHSKGDDFRSPNEIANNRKRDPLILINSVLNNESVEKVESSAKSHVNKIIEELIR